MKYRISEIGTLRNGLSYAAEEASHGCKIIGIPDFKDRYVAVLNDLAEVSDTIVSEGDLLQEGDILLVRSNGNKKLVGRCMVIPELDEHVSFSGFCIRFRPNKQVVTPLYMLYLFKSPTFRGIFSNTQQTSITNLNQATLGEIEVDIPSIGQQEAVVSVIHSITRRIDLNNRINDNLQAMMETLYDYWFMQFDFPDAEGKPYRAAGGEMVWNECLKREIPSGWKCVKLGDLLEKNSEEISPTEALPTIDLSVMPSDSISLAKVSDSTQFSTNLYKMNEGDLLFGGIRPYLHKAGIAPCSGAVAGTVRSFRVKRLQDYNFALFTLCSKNMFSYAESVSTGTRMPTVSSDDLLDRQVAYDPEIAALFNELNVGGTFVSNVREMLGLRAVRDWLHPMLMNGQATIRRP